MDAAPTPDLPQAPATPVPKGEQEGGQEPEHVLSPDLQEELSSLAPPMQGVPTDAEIRVAQAQLVGWLEGLFHGIQAALFSQQMAARAQFEELRRRGLPGSTDDQQGPGTDQSRGQYL